MRKNLWVVVVAVVGLGQLASGQDVVEMLAEEERDAGLASPQSWWEWDGMTGEWWGGRPALADHGVEVFGGYTVDVFGNTTGGVRRGVTYTGLLTWGLEVDLEKLVGWPGATVHNSWFWISGQDPGETLAGSFLDPSNIGADPTVRMFELWLQQAWWEDRASLRVGQLAADEEFLISEYAELFLNGTFGWPALTAENLPNGGPGYPMATPGVRLALEPLPGARILTAVYQGNVFAQDVNQHGFRYRLDGAQGFTFLQELQVAWSETHGWSGLPGQVKVGGWAQTGRVADPLVDSTNSGNYGLYAVLDQQLWRPGAGGEVLLAGGGKGKSMVNPRMEGSDERGLGWFARVGFTPADRNVVNFYFDTGLVWQGPWPGREEDAFGVAFGYAQLTNGAREDLREEGGNPVGASMVLEATYAAQLTPWLSVQPDVQYIIQPDGAAGADNSFLVGGRLSVTF
jgi:porin